MIQYFYWLTILERYLNVPEDKSGDNIQYHVQISFLLTIAYVLYLNHTADVLYCSSCSLLKFFLICTQSEQLSATCQTYGAKGPQGKFLTTHKMLSCSLWNTFSMLARCYNEICLSQAPIPNWTRAPKFLPEENRSCLPLRELFQQNLTLRSQFGSQSKKLILSIFVLIYMSELQNLSSRFSNSEKEHHHNN